MSGKDDKPDNYANVTYDLSEKNDATTLFITQENIHYEKTKEYSEQNWKKVLEDT